MRKINRSGCDRDKHTACCLLSRFLLLWHGAPQCCSKVQILLQYWGFSTEKYIYDKGIIVRVGQFIKNFINLSTRIKKTIMDFTFTGLSFHCALLYFVRTSKEGSGWISTTKSTEDINLSESIDLTTLWYKYKNYVDTYFYLNHPQSPPHL